MIERIPEDADLTDVLEVWRRDIFMTLNCHAVARVESFNAEEQLVQATILYPQTFFVHVQAATYRKEIVDYPVLLECPLVVIKGSGFALKIPPQVGDECLILFNDRSIDEWFNSGQKVEPDSGRLHSMSDAIALVGISSKARSLEGFEEGKAVLGDGRDDIKVGSGIELSSSSRISIRNQSTSLKAILTSLASAIPMGGGAGAQTMIDQLLE